MSFISVTFTALIAQGTTRAMPALDDVKNIVDIASKTITGIAVIVGGIWAYFKFVKGRTFARRAELSVTPSLNDGAGFSYLSVTVTLKNIGLSKLPLNPKVKALRLFGMVNVEGKQAHAATWKRIVTLPILDEYEWLEAQETATDVRAYALPGPRTESYPYPAYQIEAIVGAPRSRITGAGERWEARAVVILPPPTHSDRKLWKRRQLTRIKGLSL